MVLIQSEMRSALQIATTFAYLRPNHVLVSRGVAAFRPPLLPPRLANANANAKVKVKVRAFSTDEREMEGSAVAKKPSVCTADELHYVSVSNSDWRLALWRYTPPPQVPI